MAAGNDTEVDYIVLGDRLVDEAVPAPLPLVLLRRARPSSVVRAE
jgi:hypothetical protein